MKPIGTDGAWMSGPKPRSMPVWYDVKLPMDATLEEIIQVLNLLNLSLTEDRLPKDFSERIFKRKDK